MGYIRTFAGLLAVSATLPLAGCVGGANEPTSEPSVGEAASAFYGMASPPGGFLLNARYSPSQWSGVAYQIGSGRSLSIQCYTFGSWYNGTNLWYQLWDGTYVAGSGVSAGWGIPQCGDSGGIYPPGTGPGWGGRRR
jgi:hypothetical protein